MLNEKEISIKSKKMDSPNTSVKHSEIKDEIKKAHSSEKNEDRIYFACNSGNLPQASYNEEEIVQNILLNENISEDKSKLLGKKRTLINNDNNENSNCKDLDNMKTIIFKDVDINNKNNNTNYTSIKSKK